LNPTNGEAFINGHLVQTDLYAVRRNIGFCPQFDYLPEYLTVEQTFRLYAKLRGVKNSKISQLVGDFVNVFKLNEFSDKLVQNLSGGNKRKVSAAIAFIGKPSVVILDEPTSGMDPAAKRYLWSVITKARDLGITIVLTSHRY
jgi:ABC-type multidrug transport system ATPase subunit